jgi:PAS domain S-box-containing protein
MAVTLILAGAVGAMAFGAVMVFVSRRSDLVALSLGCFLACIAAHLLLGGAPGHWLGVASLPFFAAFVAELRPGKWSQSVAVAIAIAGVVSGIAGALMVTQALACGVAAWATFVSLRLVRERRNTWPVVIIAMAITYPVLTLGVLGLEGLEPAGFIAYVVAPGVILTRRAIRAFDAEARRALDQAKFATDVFDSVPVALSMRGLDARYVFVNRTWEKYYGHTRDDVIGTSPRDRATAAETDALLALDAAAIAAGPGNPPPPADFTLGDKRYLQTRTAMVDSQGKLLGVLTASIDTSDRKAIEEALAMEQQRLRLVVHSSKLGMLDWDGVTRSAYYSPRFKEILGYKPDADTAGWPDYFDLLHPEDAPRVRARFRNHIVSSRDDFHDPLDYRLRRADGSYVWVQAQGISVRDAKGYATRFIATLTDITQRRAQEEAVRESMRLREEVERMSRHDLKTPLNSVIAVSRLLRQSAKLSREDEELLSIVERAGYRILSMVNLSLDIFRMEQGSYQFRAQAVDLSEVARKVAADLESQAASKDVVINLKQSGHATARAEELLSYSMFANLVKNAIEAAPEGGVVTVTVEGAGDAVSVHIHNAGEISPKVRPHFFEKYATTGKDGGVGLGAYSARLMARVQEGEITMHSDAAAGTTLSVRMRAAHAATPREEHAPAAPTGSRAERLPVLPPLKVLVVDDDEFNRLVFRRMLPSPPLTLTMAVNGRAALDAARSDWPDVVLLDLEMPVMDGYEAAGRLRKMQGQAHKPLRIIAISSNDDTRSIERALNSGCDDYLVKPAARETLWAVLAGSERTPASRREEDAHEKDPVNLDADLRATLPDFLRSRREALDDLPHALAAGDREKFRRLAHKLAGSFALYGFKWAGAQCRALQDAAAQGEAADLARRVSALRTHLDSVEIR